MDSNFYLAHNINPKTLKCGDAHTVTNNIFEVYFDPAFPHIENPFVATTFTYATLSEGTFSLVGTIPYPEVFLQFSFVIPCSAKDGTHKIVETGPGVVAAFFNLNAGVFNIKKGGITFKRDTVKNTIDAHFKIYIKHQHEQEPIDGYHAKGKIFLNATGPLCGES